MNIPRTHTKKKRPPHIALLPKGAKSPTDSIYHRYDIIEQGAVLQSYADGLGTVRSIRPFIIRVLLPNGKIKDIHSRDDSANRNQ
jgi:hypothetical protein